MHSRSGVEQAETNPEVVAQSAFERRLPELEALAQNEVVPANLDVTEAITTALAAKAKLDAMRGLFVAQIRNPNFRLMDAMEDYAWALHHTQGLFLIAVKPVHCSPGDIHEARLRRKALLHALKALAARAVVNAARWKGLHRGRGRVDLAMDLNVLVQVHTHYTTHGSEIDGSPISHGLAPSADLSRALELSKLILAAFGRRKARPEIAAAEDMRNRAFTKMLMAYDEACRCTTFVRWSQRDASQLLPSLWHQEPRRRRRATEKTDQGALPTGRKGAVSSEDMPTSRSLPNASRPLGPASASASVPNPGVAPFAADADEAMNGPFFRNSAGQRPTT